VLPEAPRWPVVVFDLDGTLVDTIGLIVASYQHTFTTVLGAAQDEVRIRGWIGQPLIRAFEEVSPKHADELYANYLEWNHANTVRLIRRYPGVDAMLATLVAAGVEVAVATSKLGAPARTALRLAGLQQHVGVLVTIEDTDRHKPNSRCCTPSNRSARRPSRRSTSVTPSSTSPQPATRGWPPSE